MSINFDLLGEAMSFSMKVRKHVSDDNPYRVKDYLTVAFDNIDPRYPGQHPCFEVIKEGVSYLLNRGWRVTVYDWGEGKGEQFTCVSPSGEWFRSHYQC